MKNKQKGFIFPLIIVILALITLGGSYVYIENNKIHESNNTVTNSSPVSPRGTTRIDTSSVSTSSSSTHSNKVDIVKPSPSTSVSANTSLQKPSVTIPVTVPSPRITFTANGKVNLTVEDTQGVDFDYSSTGAEYCNRSGGATGWVNSSRLPTSGTVELPNALPAGTEVYTLTCYNSEGKSSSLSVTVNVTSSAPAHVASPEPVVLPPVNPPTKTPAPKPTSSNSAFPTITSVTSSGNPSGEFYAGDVITIHGSGFTAPTHVTIGYSSATEVSGNQGYGNSITDNAITLYTPDLPAGTYNLYVDGSNTVKVKVLYKAVPQVPTTPYQSDAPTIVSLSPSGDLKAGMKVTITGKNFNTSSRLDLEGDFYGSLTTTFVKSTVLSFVLPTSVKPGHYNLYVFENAGIGGNQIPITVVK